MADELSKPFEKSARTDEEMHKLQREQRIQITAFIFMMILTLLAFVAIGSDIVPQTFATPFILLLATVQMFLQLFYFMHLKDKNHGWPNSFFISGLVLAAPMIAGLMLIIGVVKY